MQDVQIIDHSPESQPVNVGARKIDTSKGDCLSVLNTQWMNRPKDQRYLSISEAKAAAKARYEGAAQQVIDTGRVEFIAPMPISDPAEAHLLRIGLETGGGGIEAVPTHWSFGQMARLAGAPPSYLRELPTQIAAPALQYGMRYNRQVSDIQIYYEMGGDQQLYAATGPTYGRIPDWEVWEALGQIAGEGTGDRDWKVPGKFVGAWGNYDPNVPVTLDTTTLYGSDRDMFAFLVDDRRPIEVGKLADGSPDYLFRGFYVTQGECGDKGLTIGTMYLRGVCCNRLIWGAEGHETINIRHSSGAPKRFIAQAAPALQRFAEGSARRLGEAVQEAKAAEIAETDKQALAFINSLGLSRKQSAEAMDLHQQEERKPVRSVWDAAQAVTALARGKKNQDARQDMERMAGKALDKVTGTQRRAA